MKLMVLDGNSILNRSYYGIRPLTTKDGFYTQAIYGFLVTMARLEDEERPDAVCVAFDRREPTFRHLEYEGYKAQRKGMPEELAMQLPVMKEVLDAMNIPRYELAGYEGLRRRHGRQGFAPAHHGAHDRQAHLHPHGADHHEAHDARELCRGVRL